MANFRKMYHHATEPNYVIITYKMFVNKQLLRQDIMLINLSTSQ